MVVASSCDNAIAGSVPAVEPDSMPGVEQEDTGEQPLRIMLLGKSGVGKSTSGNTIFGRYVFKSDMKLGRVTKYCEKEVGTIKNVPVDVTGEVKEVSLTVIDTPGFFETGDHNKERDIVRDILKCVRFLEPGPHAFVLVVPIGRMTKEDEDTNQLIEDKFGPRVWDYTIVLFTHGDRLEGKTINEVITESDDNLRNFIRKCSGGFHVFNNKNDQDQDQVTSFIAKIQTLVAMNGGGHYRKELFPQNEKKIREKQQSILAEKDADIRRKEAVLEEHHQGDELEEKKKMLWRREEENARQAAEEIKENSNLWIFFFFVGIVLGGLAYLAQCLPLALGISVILVILIILTMAFKGRL